MPRVRRRKNWPAIIEQLNQSKSGHMRVTMGSPGSAQVTRVRLLENYSNLDAYTDGSVLHIVLR